MNGTVPGVSSGASTPRIAVPAAFREAGFEPSTPTRVPSARARAQSFGHPLSFDCGFESGNLASVERTEEYCYTLTIRGDTEAPNHRLWYYLRVSDVQKDCVVCLRIVGFSKPRLLYNQGQTPLLRSSESRPLWAHVPSGQTYYYKTKGGCGAAVLLHLDAGEEYFLAYNYPFTLSMLTAYTNRLLQCEKLTGHVTRHTLAQTVQGRSIDLLRITDPDVSPRRKRAVLITARVHPGETPSSFVCHGVIEFLTSFAPLARALRKHIVFYVVPMLNPDGVVLGNYRCSSVGRDLNRLYLDAATNSLDVPAPEISALVELVKAVHGAWGTEKEQVTKSFNEFALSVLRRNAVGLRDALIAGDPNDVFKERPHIPCEHPLTLGEYTPLDVVIDLHSHSNCMNGFVFANPDARPELEAITDDLGAAVCGVNNLVLSQALETMWPWLLSRRCTVLSPSGASPWRFSGGSKKETAGRRVFHRFLNPAPLLYTVEVSNYCGEDGVGYTPREYGSVGRGICQALGDLYGL